jgi:hypothetical protein
MGMELRSYHKKNPFSGARAIQPSTSALADCHKDKIYFVKYKYTFEDKKFTKCLTLPPL